MKRLCLWTLSLLSFALSSTAAALPPPLNLNLNNNATTPITPELFDELEELARIVDITYCVGSIGIQKPFKCASRCHEFEGFELVDQWNTGILMSDSCGYIAISHPPFAKRIIVAFRGTYSIANTVVDLSTNPAEYLPYPSDDEETCMITNSAPSANDQLPFTEPSNPSSSSATSSEPDEPCTNCTVHAGFLTSWKNTRCTVLPLIQSAITQYPDYRLTLVGHSLGGAVATLASLEFMARGWNPQVTTFGEPRIGNQALVDYIDRKFNLEINEDPQNIEGRKQQSLRRVTHINDPIPLLPLEEWGYKMHAGEVFISKPDLPPSIEDISYCQGDEDERCIAGDSTTTSSSSSSLKTPTTQSQNQNFLISQLQHLKSLTSDPNFEIKSLDLSIPNRFRLWELFFAHRDYFWRLGLCVPAGGGLDLGVWFDGGGDGNQENEKKVEDIEVFMKEKEKGNGDL
ncbi:putative extracellular triacylglycerol [Phaeomoniella chlamydospora]|uniref:Putative extracellular triacylglycerol n=1 Tax=Phaeomoniella chlamydospora TaxID=158046 RepID=A0A0G2F443_PHACM|nr:putative extracellular triacylglycerol [Phaeomoniella chlamydospora]